MKGRPLLVRLGAIGGRVDDSDLQRLRKRLLVYLCVMMGAGSLVWGSIAAYKHLWWAAAVAFGYAVLTATNLGYFHRTKDFACVQRVQVGFSLLLPFVFQWLLGGFAASGAVMLWSLAAIIGSIATADARQSARWMAVFVALTVVSGVIDPVVARHDPLLLACTRTSFFVLNVTATSSLVVGLMLYLLRERERMSDALAAANLRVVELNARLEDLVAARTAELRDLLARSRAIIDHMADGLVALDAEGRVQAANPALARMLFLEGDVLGRHARDVVPTRLDELAARAVASRCVESDEIALDGQRTAIAIASPIAEGEMGGRDLGAVVILRDVTLEREIDRMKTDLVATVSHELRTPLTSILGFAVVTQRKLEHARGGDDDALRRAVAQATSNLGVIVTEGQRLTAMVNDLLDMAKMEAGQMAWRREAIDPRALAHRAIEASAGLFLGRAVTLGHDLTEDLPTIAGDADRLLQVLINLIANAAKFTDAGSVTLRARQVAEGLELAVVDTGRGIARADHAAVFEKFRQVGDPLTEKPRGTGLGLPICGQIVRAHGGRIDVESAIGQGSTFRVTLPTGVTREVPT